MRDREIQNHTNAKCIKCKVIEEYMCRIGAFVMCTKCTQEEFETLKPVTTERFTYMKWLGVYMKSIDDEDTS